MAGNEKEQDVVEGWTFIPDIDDLQESLNDLQQHGVEDLTDDIRTKSSDIGSELETVDEKLKDSESSSDIDIIEDETDGHLASLDTSLNSHTSSYSFCEFTDRKHILTGKNNDSVHEDLSEKSLSTADELPPNVDLKPGVKHYHHTPNTKLNVALTILMALVVAAGIGFGIGHYLGWSDQWWHQKQLSTAQVAELKQLQDELIICMQQQKATGEPKPKFLDSQVCYENTDYWKHKFEQLFAENKGLKELLERTQQELHARDPRIQHDLTQCSGDTAEKFHNLKLDLIFNQMEYLQLLKTFNEVRHQERQTRERAKKLEEENEELKHKLEEEEADDEILVQLEDKVLELKDENEELKSRLREDTRERELLLGVESQIRLLQQENRRLKQGLLEVQSSNQKTVDMVPRLTALREEINQLMGENEDLKSIVAKLRYGPPAGTADDSKHLEEFKQKINDLRQENQDLQTEIGKIRYSKLVHEEKVQQEAEQQHKASEADQQLREQLETLINLLKSEKSEAQHWKEMYEAIKNELNKPLNPTGGSTVWESLKTINWSELFQNGFSNGNQALSSLVTSVTEYLSKQNLSGDISDRLTTTGEALKSVQQNIQKKWDELQRYMQSEEVSSMLEKQSKAASKMAEVLENSVKKVYETSLKFLTNEKPLETKSSKFFSKLWKIADSLNTKWAEMKVKMSDFNPEAEAEEDEDYIYADEDVEISVLKNGDLSSDYYGEDEERKNTDWLFARAQDREVQHFTEDDSWYLERAKARASQRKKPEDFSKENWFLKRSSSWRKSQEKVKFKRKGDESESDSQDWKKRRYVYEEL